VVKKNPFKNLGLKNKISTRYEKKSIIISIFNFHTLAKFHIKNVGWFKPRLANGKISFLVTL
jgi:hypothetical protein